MENTEFQSACLPDKFVRLQINKYTKGMSYGQHIDAAHIDNIRTDISFTVFLNDSENDEGGDLRVISEGHEDFIKGERG